MKKENSGRYYIVDIKSGRKFCVEPIGKPRTDFGDSITNKCNGSITEKESIVTEDNGFVNIGYSKNPLDYVEKLLQK